MRGKERKSEWEVRWEEESRERERGGTWWAGDLTFVCMNQLSPIGDVAANTKYLLQSIFSSLVFVFVLCFYVFMFFMFLCFYVFMFLCFYVFMFLCFYVFMFYVICYLLFIICYWRYCRIERRPKSIVFTKVLERNEFSRNDICSLALEFVITRNGHLDVMKQIRVLVVHIGFGGSLALQPVNNTTLASKKK